MIAWTVPFGRDRGTVHVFILFDFRKTESDRIPMSVRITTGYQANSVGKLPVFVSWTCSSCGKKNKQLDWILYSGSSRGGVFADKQTLSNEAELYAEADLRQKMSDVSKGNYNDGKQKFHCSCEYCEKAELWTQEVPIENSFPKYAKACLVWGTLVLLVFIGNISDKMTGESIVLLILTLILFVIGLRLFVINLIKLIRLNGQLRRLPKESLPTVTLPLLGMDTQDAMKVSEKSQ